MVAIGGIADKVGPWRALDMTRLTLSRHGALWPIAEANPLKQFVKAVRRSPGANFGN